ncbi:MAG: DUF4965 domain-containing protein [Clostridia bacterium]|nr:DUF4965 domain-containing protein [Clostridia bacterium]
MKQLLPAYPLFVKDPYFSVWCDGEILNENDPVMWWGERKPMLGIARVDGVAYGFFGNVAAYEKMGLVAAKQTALSVDAFSTRYEFALGKARLAVRFVSPLPFSDLSLLSMPACYMEYEVFGAETAEISLVVGKGICYNISTAADTDVYSGVTDVKGGAAAFVGLARQLLLANAEDLIGADYGYWYAAGDTAFVLDEEGLASYIGRGSVSCASQDILFIGASSEKKKGSLVLAFDNSLAVQYFESFLKGYYLEDHTVIEAIEYTLENTASIHEILADFEADLKEKAAPYGEEYYRILIASLRQSIAGHSLVRDKDGNILFFSKECNSNGCIGTVDVSYPSIPLYLLYAPELVRGMMRPILKFASYPVWKYDFAPHDVGTFPLANGQVYGLANETSRYHGNSHKIWKQGAPQTRPPYYLYSESYDAYLFDQQMPVEECANMLIMCCAACKADGDYRIFSENRVHFDAWVEYLVKYGLRPDTQLCTDDFAGHLKNNVNLAIKAAVGIASYAALLEATGENGEKYQKIAKEFADDIMAFGEQYSHIPLTFDSDDTTFSLKYNMAFDKILGFGLFSDECREREVDAYIARSNRYGTPLDSREDYTKSDWLVWAASLTDSVEKKKALIAPLARFLSESKTRVPFSDWYFTTEGTWRSFRARTVQGGCFILLL